MKQRFHKDDLWVLATLFDPSGTKSRQGGHYALVADFLRHVSAPVALVEISMDGNFQLSDADADLVVRMVSGESVWHKEAALNRLVASLPEACSYVTWIDVDLHFPEPDWLEQVRWGLQRHTALQLFSSVRYLDENGGAAINLKGDPVTSQGIVSAARRGLDLSATAPGGAWAASRMMIADVGLYDACVVGGGDCAWAYAVLGKVDECVERLEMTSATARHYRAWASRLEGWDVDVGFLDISIDHVWHGPIEGRGYLARQKILAKHGHDPSVHLNRADNGLLRFEPSASDLRADVRRHFQYVADGSYFRAEARRVADPDSSPTD